MVAGCMDAKLFFPSVTSKKIKELLRFNKNDKKISMGISIVTFCVSAHHW